MKSINRRNIIAAVALGILLFCSFCCSISLLSNPGDATRTPRPTNTMRPTTTPRPSNTPRPTATPRLTNTPRPSATIRPTQTTRPTRPPTATQPPSTPTPAGGGASSAVCSCAGDTLNCSDFRTQVSAQACFNYCVAQGRGDIHRLDRDGDGRACESLP